MPQNDFNLQLMKEFRENGGKVGGAFAGMPVVILNMTGAKSGEPQATPLVYSKDGDDFVLIASMGGAPKNPAWYYNLKAHPRVTLEVGTEKFEAEAIETEGEERERLYAAQAEKMPAFNEYRQKTTRTIPVFRLKRI